MLTKGNCTNQGARYAQSVYSVLAKGIESLEQNQIFKPQYL